MNLTNLKKAISKKMPGTKNYNYAVYCWMGDVNPHIRVHKKGCGHIRKHDRRNDENWMFFSELDKALEYGKRVTNQVRSDPNRPYRGDDPNRFYFSSL